MGETTTVHVVRHGEVENPTGVLYGRLAGFGLSERGRAQAEAVADALAADDVVLVRASPLQRAQETATPIAAPTTSCCVALCCAGSAASPGGALAVTVAVAAT